MAKPATAATAAKQPATTTVPRPPDTSTAATPPAFRESLTASTPMGVGGSEPRAGGPWREAPGLGSAADGETREQAAARVGGTGLVKAAEQAEEWVVIAVVEEVSV